MPLAVLTTVTPPPVAPPTYVQPQPGSPHAVWIDPDGQQWELSGPSSVHGWFTTNRIAGWGATPVTIVTDPLARGGVRVRHIRPEPRRLTWPLHIHGEDDTGFMTHVGFLARYRPLMRAFTKTTQRGRPGVLRVTRPDGSAREIEAFYEDGFGGEATENWLTANPVLTLFCPDGYWRDPVAHSVRREYTGAATPYLDPYPTISASNVLGETQIVNPGDVEGWPVWTLTGPADGLTATNHTLGAAFTIDHALLAGEQIVIDTAPGRPTVRGPSDVNLIGALDWPDATLWPLVDGVNGIDFAVAGAGSGTVVELTYHPRYEAA